MMGVDREDGSTRYERAWVSVSLDDLEMAYVAASVRISQEVSRDACFARHHRVHDESGRAFQVSVPGR